MLDWIRLHIEVVPLIMNLCILSGYLAQWDQPGKTLYWLGACILTVGLLFMKG